MFERVVWNDLQPDGRAAEQEAGYGSIGSSYDRQGFG